MKSVAAWGGGDIPVKVMLRDVTFRRALTAVLDSVDSKMLRFAVVSGVIEMSTVARIYQHAVIHVYDVRDLIKDAPQPDVQAQVIAEILEHTVDPEGWKRLPPIKHLSGQLIVTNISENHATIVAILNRLRQADRPPIELQVHVLHVTEEFLKSLEADIKPPMGEKGGAEHVTLISEETLKLLLDRVKTAQGCRVIAAPKLVVMDGQQGEISLGTDRESELSIAVTPKIAPNRAGVELAVKADLLGALDAINTSLDIPMDRAALLTRADSMTMMIIRTTLEVPGFPLLRR